MTPRPDPLDRRDAALLHAAIDAPEAAVAAWVGVDTDAFLEGELSAGALPLLPLIWHNLAEAGYEALAIAEGLTDDDFDDDEDEDVFVH